MYAHLALLVVVVLLLRSVAAATRQHEIAALETLYKGTGGSAGRWTFLRMNDTIRKFAVNAATFGNLDLTGASWDFKKNAAGDYVADPCAARDSGKNFAGIGCTCYSNECSITQICLPGGNLVGSLASIVTALQNFTQLNFLNLHSNALTGTIPSAVGNFDDMTFLSLFLNSLTGSIPSSLGRLTKLKYLDLERNNLLGSIPSSLGRLSKLEYTWLSDNSLSGSISSELGQLTNLQRLYLFGNSLTGPIPPQIGNMSSLLYLGMNSNSISGTIPRELEKLKNLITLYLFSNMLTGTIPKELANMNQLEHMYLSTNSLRGNIPVELADMNNLVNFGLSSNSLSGTIPAALGRLINLQQLSLHENSLTGFIPAELDQCKNLTSIDLSNNALTGTIPSNFAALDKLERFLVQVNNLQNSIEDADVAALNFIDPLVQRKLKFLDIAENNFEGTLPKELFDLPSLEVLYAGSNCFSGTLPSNICSATNLKTLELASLSSGSGCRRYIWAGTAFEGAFKAFVSINKMNGSFPSCAFELPHLQSLNANGNNLLGTVPITISPLLKHISLSRNKLFGTISDSFATSANLTSLDLSYNRVTGNLDAFTSSYNEQLFAKKDMVLSLQINSLSGDIPDSLHDLRTVNILDGNVFACATASDQKLPVNDHLVDSYRCGSEMFNRMMFSFVALLFVAAILWWCMRHSTGMRRCFGKFKLWFRVAAGNNILSDTISITELAKYTQYLQKERWFNLMIGTSTFFGLLCYLSLAAENSSNQTVDDSYAWVLTAAYMTGQKSTIALLSCGIALICYVWVLEYFENKTWKFEDRKVIDDVRLTVSTKLTENNDVEGNDTFLTTLRIKVLTVVRLFTVIMVLFGVITGGNIWFVNIQLQGTISQQRLFQLGFALFNIIWSMIVMPIVLETTVFHFRVDVKHHDALERFVFGGRYQMLFALNIFISFFIPIFAVALVNKACFYHALYESTTFETATTVEDCVYRFTSGVCAISVDYISVSKSQPPFTYGYTCSNSILKLYVPLFCQMSILLILKSIASLVYLCWDTYATENGTHDAPRGVLQMFITELVLKMTPYRHLLINTKQRKHECKPGRVFNTSARAWITRPLPANLAQNVTLLTFGFAAPPLAVIMTISMLMNSCVCQLVFGRFLETEMSVLLEHKRLSEAEADAPIFKPNLHFISLRRQKCMQDDIKDIEEPWGALAALKAVEQQCQIVPASAVAKQRSVFILITSALFALLLIDVENSTLDGNLNTSAASIMISVGCAIVVFRKIYRSYSRNEKKKLLLKEIQMTPMGKFKMSPIKSLSEIIGRSGSRSSDLPRLSEADTTMNPISDFIDGSQPKRTITVAEYENRVKSKKLSERDLATVVAHFAKNLKKVGTVKDLSLSEIDDMTRGESIWNY